VVMGHEFAGTVASWGGRRGLSIGDAVAVEPYYVCGTCVACRRPVQRLPVARLRRAGRYPGRLLRAVCGRQLVHKLGGLGTDVGALVEPLAVGYHAVRLSGAKGVPPCVRCGPIGLVTSLAEATARAVISWSRPRARQGAGARGRGADPTEVDVLPRCAS